MSDSDPAADAFRRAEHAARSRSPAHWLATAHDLRDAAETLSHAWLEDLARVKAGLAGPRLHLGPVFLMLMGMSMEAVLKAVLRAQRKDVPTRGHPLKRLAADAMGSAMTTQDGCFLDRLSAFVIWAGRYPVPKDAARFERGKTTMSEDPEMFVSLFDRVEALTNADARALGRARTPRR